MELPNHQPRDTQRYHGIMPIHIAEATRKALCNELGVSRLVEVMEYDFQDISPDADVDRNKAALYVQA